MYFLTRKFITSKLVTTYRIRFKQSYVENSILNLMKMASHRSRSKTPNAKPQKIVNEYLTPTVQIQVIGNGAAGIPSSLIMINSNSRYLINCGEGTQKLGNEYRMNLEKVSHIFVTYPSWNNISGLVGLCLSIEQAYRNEVFVHGLNFFESVCSSLIKLIKKKNFKIIHKSSCHYEEFSDGITLVKYIHLQPSSCKNLGDSATSKLDEENELNTESEFEEKTEKKCDFNTKNHPNTKLSNKCKHDNNGNETNKRNHSENNLEIPCVTKRTKKHPICYIFQTKKTSGALLYEKCMEYGVPSGPLLGNLKRGQDVQLPDGTIIRSVDVKEPDLPGVTIIIVDCPSVNFLDSLLEEQSFQEYQSSEKIAELVIHFSSSQVVKNLKYQEWISHFPKETKHLFLNEDNKQCGSVGIARQQFKLNFLQSDIFPLLHGIEIPEFPRAENCTTDNGQMVIINENNTAPIYSDKTFYKCNENNSFIYGETLCTVFLKPKQNYDYTKCLVLKKDEFLSEIFKNDMKEKIEKCKEKLKNIELSIQADNRIYPKIVFLGTGSSKPSKVRNSSGILIFLDEKKCILFDCGENIYNQLIIFYGKQKTSEILRKLDAVYISHLHLDHHLGLVTILKKRKLAFDKLKESSLEKLNVQTMTTQEFQPLLLLAPVKIQKWLETYCNEFENISEYYRLIPNSFLIKNAETPNDKEKLCKKRLNLRSIMTSSVCHCNGSYGISIIHENGCKITYSGDTTPCETLIDLGMNSDILIHEATFDDFFYKEARIKMHSTVNQAIDVGRKMNAKYILLTHFSQRYCYLPMIEEKFRDLNIGIAFDFMEVPYNKLPLLPALLEPLEYIFSDFNEKLKSGRNSFLKRVLDQRNISQFESSASSNDEESPAKILKI